MNQFILKLRILLLQNKIYYILFIISSIYALSLTNLFVYKSRYNLDEKQIVGKLTNIIIDGNKISIELLGKEKIIGKYYAKKESEIIKFKNDLKLGDTILINGLLTIPKKNTIPNTFNYRKYLYNKKIYYTIKIDSIEKIKDNNNLFYKIKDMVFRRISKISNNKYLYTFIVGENAFIETNISETYKNNGISHLFALSGMHVSVLSSFIILFLKKIKVSELLQYIITFIFLMIFSFISGFSPSILRASFFFFLLGINKVFYFYIKSSNILLLVFFILVIINPFIIYSLGFILSFTITYFILIYYEEKQKTNYFKSLFLTSIVSFFSSFGIIIYNYYEINILSIIFNLFFVPYVSFVVYPFSLLTFIFPKITSIFYYITLIMEKISSLFNNIKIGKIIISKTNIIYIIIYYILLYALIKLENKKALIFIIIINLYYYFIPYFDNKTYLYFLDVGQGDSIFIKTPYNKNNIIIDMGGTVTYEEENWSKKTNVFSLTNTLCSFYKSVGTKKINYLFITHGDEDHIGYALDLKKYIKIQNTYINKGSINHLEQKLDDKKIYDKKVLKINNIIIYSLNDKIYDNENENSMILLIIINNKKILLMADASIIQEKYIIEKYDLNNVDILKVGHHGSKTSSSKTFLKEVEPLYSIISVGKNNRFGHPNEKVLNDLNKYSKKVYKTSDVGTIEFIFDKDIFFINNH